MNSTLPLLIDGGLVPAGLAPALVQDDEQAILRYAVCPMCHAPAPVTLSAIEAGGDWRCVRCGQHWDAARLVALAAYANWAADHDRVGRLDTEGHPVGAVCGGAPVERPGAKP